MAENMCIKHARACINDALSRLAGNCNIGSECNGGVKAMSKYHPSQGPYRIRMQWWDEGHEPAPSQPRSVSDMADDGSRRQYEIGCGLFEEIRREQRSDCNGSA